MAGAQFKKRGRDDGPKSKTTRPSKKLKKQTAYHSSSDGSGSDAEDTDDFQAVNLLDSDEDDIHNANVDDGADSDEDDGASSSGSDAPVPKKQLNKKKATKPSIAKNAPKSALAKDAPSDNSEDQDGEDDSDDYDDNDEYSDLDDEAASGDEAQGGGKSSSNKKGGNKSKRSDPDAFANSLSKILSTKLSSTRRADPVLARSAEAQEASRRAVDIALEQKARKKLRDQKRLAMEKGRVRDVLVATNSTFSNINPVTGEVMKDELAIKGETTGEILETERRLRKVAQRGVVQLFNAFRTAQVKAAEAEKVTKKEGVIGIDRKKEKVTEMSKKGFLDLIASGGGGLKKGPLEEA